MNKSIKRKSSYLKKPIIIVISFLMLIIFIHSIFSVRKKIQKISLQEEIVISELNELQEKEYFLQEELDSRATDFGLEKELREVYGYAKKGEKVVVVVRDENDSIKKEEVVEDTGFLSKYILNIFR